MEKKNLIKELIIVFWLFIIGSILGYIFEMIVVLFQKGYFESRQGLIYGPFIPVYGIGAIIYYLILNNIKKDNKLKIETESGNIGVIAKLGNNDTTLINDTGEYEDNIYVSGVSYYLTIKLDDFKGNIDIIAE